jgi:hypothetical protein
MGYDKEKKHLDTNEIFGLWMVFLCRVLYSWSAWNKLIFFTDKSGWDGHENNASTGKGKA